jgi:50S ribosomal protein L16 3-hydroxylase
MARPTNSTLLGGMSERRFLARHWQRRALLVRGALPGFQGLFTRASLFALASRDDVESRLVVRDGSTYTLEHGPFTGRALRALPARDWTLLIQGVNLVDHAADALLRRFAFIGYARLDDVMASYAAPGGGVGPHFDSYDVFLLQAFGRRRWRYGAQSDLSLRPGLPVKILRRFTPRHDAMLEAGDMLYLPPNHAHDGIALDACTTYSIGFRAPAHQELVEAFLDRLRDTLVVDGRYSDRNARPAPHPARLDPKLLRALAATIARIRWTGADVQRFIGCHLTEPKPHVTFTPRSPMTHRSFAARARRHGLRLDVRTQLLYDGRNVFINGSDVQPPPDALGVLAQLGDARAIGGEALRRAPAASMALLHEWHGHGYIEFDD